MTITTDFSSCHVCMICFVLQSKHPQFLSKKTISVYSIIQVIPGNDQNTSLTNQKTAGITWYQTSDAPVFLQQTIRLKMADQGRSDVCVVFTVSLCALELKQTVINLLFQVIGFEIR